MLVFSPKSNLLCRHVSKDNGLHLHIFRWTRYDIPQIGDSPKSCFETLREHINTFHGSKFVWNTSIIYLESHKNRSQSPKCHARHALSRMARVAITIRHDITHSSRIFLTKLGASAFMKHVARSSSFPKRYGSSTLLFRQFCIFWVTRALERKVYNVFSGWCNHSWIYCPEVKTRSFESQNGTMAWKEAWVYM